MRPARRLRAVRRRGFVPAVDQVRQPFFCNAAAQAAAIEALRHQDAVADRVERAVVARVELEDGLRGWASSLAESQANFAWFDLPVRDGEDAGRGRGGVVAGWPSAASSCAPAPRWARAGALRVTYGTPARTRASCARCEQALAP